MNIVLVLCSYLFCQAQAMEDDRKDADIIHVRSSDLPFNDGTLIEIKSSEGETLLSLGFPIASTLHFKSNHLQVMVNERFAIRAEEENLTETKYKNPFPGEVSGTFLQIMNNKLSSVKFNDHSSYCYFKEGQFAEKGDPSNITIYRHGTMFSHMDKQLFVNGKKVSLPKEMEFIETYYVYGNHIIAASIFDNLTLKRYFGIIYLTEELEIKEILPIPQEVIHKETINAVVNLYGELNDEILISLNSGTTYVFNVKDKIWSLIFASQLPSKSNQFYCSLVIDDYALIGHYPSGQLFKYKNKSLVKLDLIFFNPELVSPLNREIQSITLWNNRIYLGVWPWSEIWSIDKNLTTPRYEGRLIKHPPFNRTVECPYFINSSSFTEYNFLGQRANTMQPYENKLFVSSSSKRATSLDHNEVMKIIPSSAMREDYGSIFSYNSASTYSVPLKEKEGENYLDLFIKDNGKDSQECTLKVYLNTEVMIIMTISKLIVPFLKESNITIGKGIFGAYKGTNLKSTIEKYFS